MKKAAAFLTLVFTITLLFLVYYINNDQLYPAWKDLDPAISLVKGMVHEQFHKPILAGAGIFWLSAFLLSLMVLREPSDSRVVEASAGARDEKALELENAKNQVAEAEKKLSESEAEKRQLQQQASDLEAQVKNLLAQLEKFNSGSETEAEKQLKEKLSSAETALAEVNKKADALAGTNKSLEAEKARLSSENEALMAKIEKSESECKSSRKESDKLSSQLKSAASEKEALNEELAILKKTVEELGNELKAAQANIKGGKDAVPPAAYQILYLFQKEGRLIDLLSEDISELDDETLGGAIRPIHEGCRKLLEERLILERVLNEDEGSEITLDEIDPESIKLSGRVPAKGPYKGELIHRGWRLKECNLPELVDGWKGNVIAPAEIEIS